MSIMRDAIFTDIYIFLLLAVSSTRLDRNSTESASVFRTLQSHRVGHEMTQRSVTDQFLQFIIRKVDPFLYPLFTFTFQTRSLILRYSAKPLFKQVADHIVQRYTNTRNIADIADQYIHPCFIKSYP